MPKRSTKRRKAQEDEAVEVPAAQVDSNDDVSDDSNELDSKEETERLEELRQRHNEMFTTSSFWNAKYKEALEDPDEELIRVNLPETEALFDSGNGEGCWARVSKRTKQADALGKWGGAFVALMQNFPIYEQWRHLTIDSPVVFQMRGPNKRAVAYLHQAKALKEAEKYEKSKKKPANSRYALIDYVPPTCQSILDSSETFTKLKNHSLWGKMKASLEAQAKPDRADTVNVGAAKVELPRFATAALTAHRFIFFDNLCQYVKFVGATLSAAPKYDFAVLLELLGSIKIGLAARDKFPRMFVQQHLSEGTTGLFSQFWAHAPVHFKPNIPRKENNYPCGIFLICIYELMYSAIEHKFRALLADTVIPEQLNNPGETTITVIKALERCADKWMEDHREDGEAIINQIIAYFVDLLTSIQTYADEFCSKK